MRRSTIILSLSFAVAVALVVWQQVRMPEDISKRQAVVSEGSAAFVRVVTVADRFLSGAGVDWGRPIRVEWQSSYGRYVVSYRTPESERLLGNRAVHVDDEGKAWFVPRG